jgi:hypothetical protein
MKSFIIGTILLCGSLCLVTVPVAAQQNLQTQEIAKKPGKPAPHLADGHIDLGNGKGVWSPSRIEDMSGHGGGERPGPENAARQLKMLDHQADVVMLPWAKKVYDEREASISKDDPESWCLPPGVPRMMNTPFPMQIYQLPDRIMQVFEGGAHMWRVIYTDGRKHTPADQWNPTYLGESIGHWEGDTMVVDVTGFNDKSWLDAAGHPHTEQLHVIERYTRTKEDNMHFEATIDDPGTYAKPWTTGWNVKWVPNWELYEYVCQENNKDVMIEHHMVGALPGERKAQP